MLVLRTFGGLFLENGGRPIVGAATQQRRLALLAALSAAGNRGLTRDRLLALFWPEVETEKARGACNQALYALRRDTGEDRIVLGSSTLRLNPEVIDSDLARFEAAIAANDLAAAVAWYTGPFLDGTHIGDSNEFDRWCDDQRARLENRWREALGRLAAEAAQRGDAGAALDWYRRLAAADPLSASAALGYLGALEAAGEWAAALRHAEKYTSLVRDELGIGPSPAIVELVSRVRQRSAEVPQGAAQPAANAPAPVVVVARSAGATPGSRRSGAAAILLGVGASIAVLAAIFSPVASSDVQIAGVAVVIRPGTIDPELTGALATFENRLRDGIVATGLARPISADSREPARLTVEISAARAGDDRRLSATVFEGNRSTAIAVLGAGRVMADSIGSEIERLRDQVMATVAGRLDPLMASWSHAASMPTSWAGYQALRLGIQAFVSDDRDRADAQLRIAASHDPSSSAALVWAAFVAAEWLSSPAADSLIAAAEEPGRRRGAWEEGLLAVLRAWSHGDLVAAHAAGHRLVEAVPGSEWTAVVALDAYGLGRASEALALLESADLERGWWRDADLPRYVLTSAHHHLGDHRAELAIASEWLRRAPDSRTRAQLVIRALGALGDGAAIERLCLVAATRPAGITGPSQPCGQGVSELRAHGWSEAAGRLVALATGSGDRPPEALDAARRRELAEWYYDAGAFDRAEVTLAGDPDPSGDDLSWLPAALAARRGERVRASYYLARRSGPAGLGPKQRFDELLDYAEVAAWLSDREEAVSRLNLAFRSGFRLRSALHLSPGLARLRGYPPFDAIVEPIEDRQHVARFRPRRPMTR